jgi:hypothetical protein
MRSSKEFKTSKLSVLLLSILLPALASCAWFQKHESSIDCATVDVVADAPALLAIVESCGGIASPTGLLPCVQAVAETRWPANVISCFTAAAQGKASCPAYSTARVAQKITIPPSLSSPSPSSTAPASNMKVTSSSGMVFTVGGSNPLLQIAVPTLPGILIDQSVTPMHVRGLFLNQSAASQSVSVLPNNQYNYGYQGQWSATGPLTASAVCYMGNTCSPTWNLPVMYAALVGGMAGYRGAFLNLVDCQAWVKSLGLGGITLRCTYGWFNVVG